MINVLSVFDGISVAKIALTNLNIPNWYIASETDKYAIKISENNWSDIIRLEDVRDIQASDFDENIDLLIGGSPCQGFSLQGLQRGLEDERSGLVNEFIRLKKELNPSYFLLENVKMNQKCKDFITKALGVPPIMINSLAFTCQSRSRLYWTNIDVEDVEYPEWNIGELEDGWRPGVTKKGPPRHVVFTPYFGCLTATYYKGVRADGRPLLTKKEGLFDEIKDSVKMLTPRDCENLQGIPEEYTAGVSNTQRYKALGNAFTLPVIEHILKGVDWSL